MKIVNIQVIDTCIQDARTQTYQLPDGLIEELCDTDYLLKTLSSDIRAYMKTLSIKADAITSATKGGLNDKKGD